MRIFVTGATGFVGRHLVPKLIEANHEVLELTRDVQKSQKYFGDNTQKVIANGLQANLQKSIDSFKPEIVIHLAAYLTAADSYETMKQLTKTNIDLFCDVLDAIKNIDLKLFINTGTFAEYYLGDDTLNPAYLYAATKTASRSFLDYYSKAYNFKQATVVPYTIYGGIDTQKKVIDYIYDSIRSDEFVDMSPGEQVLDFIHIDDVTDFYLQLVEKVEDLPQKNNYKLGTGKGHTLKEIAYMIETITGMKTKINWGAKDYRKTDVMYAVAPKINLYEWNTKISLYDGLHMFCNKN